jgi:hypothetical protein
MKLAEIKVALIQQFFKECDNGVDQNKVAEVFESLSKKLNADLTMLSEGISEEMHSGNSSEPSKAFKKFTEGRKALLTINEDEGRKTMSLFAAVRVGTEVMYCDLTKEMIEEKKGNLLTIKQALRQSKNVNDEVYFNIQNDDLR